MPNRILKESICTSDNLNSLTPQQEVFFYRLIVNCDDYGIADARPAILKAKCFPLKNNIRDSDIIKWLNALIKAELCFVYEVAGKCYLKIQTWEGHQQIRAKRSKFPKPDIICNQLISDDSICPRNPIQSNPNPNPNAQAQFEQFWNEYPKKRSKGDGEKAWLQIKPNKDLFNKIMAGLNKAKLSQEWAKDDGQFIPYPASWLRKKGWEDEYKQAKPELSSHGHQQFYVPPEILADLEGSDTQC
jgi:hypothetical protein